MAVVNTVMVETADRILTYEVDQEHGTPHAILSSGENNHEGIQMEITFLDTDNVPIARITWRTPDPNPEPEIINY